MTRSGRISVSRSRFSILPFVSMVVTALAGIGMLVLPVSAAAVEAPVKEILTSHLGWEVDTITKGDICAVSSGHECQSGQPSSQPGGFEHPRGIAGARDGNVYVVDSGNHRVQELTAAGAFVLMFGWDVNEAKVTQASKGASVSQAEENVCGAGEECQAGIEGPAAGQFGEQSAGIAVDPASGDVYVADTVSYSGKNTSGERVQKFTSKGVYILEIGKEVNETKTLAVKAKGGTPSQQELEEENLCTQEEVAAKAVKCSGPAPSANIEPSKIEPGSLYRVGGIAVGGPEGRLYVADNKHLREFTPGGVSVSEPAEAISTRLAQITAEPVSRISGIAVDDSCSLHEPVLSEPACKEFDSSYGDVYLTYEINFTTSVIRRFDSTGQETEFPVSPRTAGSAIYLLGRIAVDRSGRIALIEQEYTANSSVSRGALYEPVAAGLHLITEFAYDVNPYIADGIAFNGNDDLYLSSEQPGHEVSAYAPVAVGELEAGSASCSEGVGPLELSESSVTFSCALSGQVNPWGVPQTQAWFQWGATPGLGSETPKQTVCTNVCGSTLVGTPPAMIEGLRPNQTIYFQVAGGDEHVVSPELLTSERVSFVTPVTPPRVVGESSVSRVHFASTDFYGEVNPENAPTTYRFQYGACEGALESCATVSETETLESDAYGPVATTLEATGLQSATTYHYRLVASNGVGQSTFGPEGTFTTAPAPIPRAQTGVASPIGATGATIAGSVNPGGEPAIYTFELGVYNGANTHLGIVLSASAGASSVPVEKSVALSGLQPGTTYAYRIAVKSGFGEQDGATLTFTTQGLPAVLALPVKLGLLTVPSIAFPKAVATSKSEKVKLKKRRSRRNKRHKSKKKGRHAARKSGVRNSITSRNKK